MQGHLGERKLRSQVKRLSQIIGRRTGSGSSGPCVCSEKWVLPGESGHWQGVVTRVPVRNTGRLDWIGDLRKADQVNPSLGVVLEVEGEVQEHPRDDEA